MIKRTRKHFLLTPQGSSRLIGAALLLAWAVYISIVTVSNGFDLMASFGWEQWAFRSGNLDYIATATKIYFQNSVINQVLLGLVIVWEGCSAILLTAAAIAWIRNSTRQVVLARLSLFLLVLLWFAFAITTELFIAYDRGVNESAYWVLAVTVMVSALAIENLSRIGR